MTPRWGARVSTPVLLAYTLFILVGLGAGVSGVLLLAQIRDYGVDQATIGITFLTSSAGFFLASATTGNLIHRGGTRMVLLLAGGVYVVAGLYTATRPSFVALVGVQFLTGYGTGLMESVLNAYLAALPKATVLLNRLHAFFGVGALLGPLLATWMLSFTTWPMVMLALTGFCVPLIAAVAVSYPDRSNDPVLASTTRVSTPNSPDAHGALLPTALRQRGVLLGTALLAVYVGLEIGTGNWGFSYLVEARGMSDVVAGYTISGYWLGLTLGRFLISPIVTRLGFTAIGLMYLCLGGVVVAGAAIWVLPVSSVGFVLLGFFLGPIFPTTMAVAAQVTVARLVPTAIGVMNAGSIVGGSVLPWLAGAAAQGFGPATLLPFVLVLAVIQLVVWWRMTQYTPAIRSTSDTVAP